MAESVGSEKLFTERERWICIYPTYINSKRTLAQGRKISRYLCVENPSVIEIKDVLSASKFQVDIEPKYYPRDIIKDLANRGRVRVQIRDPKTGLPIDENLRNKEAILKHLGQMIPKLKTRVAASSGLASAAKTLTSGNVKSTGTGGKATGGKQMASFAKPAGGKHNKKSSGRRK